MSTGRPRIHLASRNAKKIAEMQRILREHAPDLEVVGLDDVAAYDEPVEDQPTFAGNALLKARAGHAATGLPTLADDSGLCVDALNGMPGVLSARWAGPGPRTTRRNNALLLAQLADVPEVRRGAHFACAVAFVDGPGEHGQLVVEGRMEGTGDPTSCAARAASATTRSSWPTSTASPSAPAPSSTRPRRTGSPTAAAPCARSPRSWRPASTLPSERLPP